MECVFPATGTESILGTPHGSLTICPVSLLPELQKLALFWNIDEQILINFQF